MKRIDAQKYINEILEFANGKIIEHKSVGSGTWYEDENPSFACHLEYRIKPEPKLVPFTFEDNLLFRDKWITEKGYTNISKVVKIFHNNIHIGDGRVFTYSELLHRCEFEDGSPCGKYINE